MQNDGVQTTYLCVERLPQRDETGGKTSRNRSYPNTASRLAQAMMQTNLLTIAGCLIMSRCRASFGKCPVR